MLDTSIILIEETFHYYYITMLDILVIVKGRL